MYSGDYNFENCSIMIRGFLIWSMQECPDLNPVDSVRCFSSSKIFLFYSIYPVRKGPSHFSRNEINIIFKYFRVKFFSVRYFVVIKTVNNFSEFFCDGVPSFWLETWVSTNYEINMESNFSIFFHSNISAGGHRNVCHLTVFSYVFMFCAFGNDLQQFLHLLQCLPSFL